MVASSGSLGDLRRRADSRLCSARVSGSFWEVQGRGGHVHRDIAPVIRYFVIGAWSFLAEHHEEALPVAPATAWCTVTGPVAFSCLALFTLGFWTFLPRARVSGKRLPRCFGVNPRLLWKNFSYHLVTLPEAFAPGGSEAGTGPSSCVSLRALFPLTLYLAVTVPDVWVLLLSTKI